LRTGSRRGSQLAKHTLFARHLHDVPRELPEDSVCQRGRVARLNVSHESSHGSWRRLGARQCSSSDPSLTRLHTQKFETIHLTGHCHRLITDYTCSRIGRDWEIANYTHLYSTPSFSASALCYTHALLNTSRYWLVTSVTISSSDLSSRPRTFSAFEASETPGLDFLVPVAGT
jgi:hypothetical protein